MIATITLIPAPVDTEGDDRYVWRHGEDKYKPCFSSVKTWEQIRMQHPTVAWSKIVWFPHAIPRFSFITWLTLKDRLSTGARSRAWGCIQACLLCGEPDETRDHLFFACPYYFTVWIDLVGYLLGSHVNPNWSITIASLLSSRRKEIDTCLLKLTFQTTIYSLWRERNSRRHQGHPQSAAHMVRIINKLIKNRISSLRHRRPSFYSDMMQCWMGHTT
ncbi:PREDICTED: uncharacterized protein LOC106314717 [Brassica oleracea var. oleracea]|uniref:uncharacterized protein LOC106314717 n=1 Tax=Brassica oleracea var. oleracea TaxID=109376 RepID=UPI0006A728EA|nr:PREDICTED: uncharacterized protein LOC106314717 [Brassica oleracea var. oleracea]